MFARTNALKQVDANMPMHSNSSSSHEMPTHRDSATFIRRPRMFRSRSPAPAMIPRAIDTGSIQDSHVLMRGANSCDGAGEDDDMPPLFDELTDQVLPHGSFDVAHYGTQARADAVPAYAVFLQGACDGSFGCSGLGDRPGLQPIVRHICSLPPCVGRLLQQIGVW